MTDKVDKAIEAGRIKASAVFEELIRDNTGRTSDERMEVVVAIQYVVAGLCYSLTKGDREKAIAITGDILQGALILISNVDDELDGFTIH